MPKTRKASKNKLRRHNRSVIKKLGEKLSEFSPVATGATVLRKCHNFHSLHSIQKDKTFGIILLNIQISFNISLTVFALSKLNCTLTARENMRILTFKLSGMTFCAVSHQQLTTRTQRMHRSQMKSMKP